MQGQAAGQALPTSEEFAGGGLGTVRGYLEAEALGDNALFGSLELRSPSLLHWFSDKSGEWRVYVFCEGGMLALNDPLPEQQSRFNLASYGIGSRFRLAQHLNGSIDFGVPLISGVSATSHDPLVTFRVWAEF